MPEKVKGLEYQQTQKSTQLWSLSFSILYGYTLPLNAGGLLLVQNYTFHDKVQFVSDRLDVIKKWENSLFYYMKYMQVTLNPLMTLYFASQKNHINKLWKTTNTHKKLNPQKSREELLGKCEKS